MTSSTSTKNTIADRSDAVQLACADIQQALPSSVWSVDGDINAPFLREWRDRWQGVTPLLLRPKTTQQVSDIVKICAKHSAPITVQGGNTGLVGGQTPQGEILLSTQNLNKVRATNQNNMSMVCEAGVTLQAAQEAAQNIGLKFPLSLASEGSCTIGGNLSTNAGGVHVLKYGSAKDLVFGVEAVMADGEIFNGLTDLRKDNTGYDISKLLLGAEGSLGIITAASLKLFPTPRSKLCAFMGLSSPAAALELLGRARLGNQLAMFELIPNLGMEYVTSFIPNTKHPFTAPCPWYVLAEWEFSTGGDQSLAPVQAILEQAFEAGIISDAVIAKNDSEAQALRFLRENLSASQKPIGASIKHDITVPISDIASFIERANAAIEAMIPNCRPLPFGHLGDGNIHYNIGQPEGMKPADFMALEPRVNDCIYGLVHDMGGSISAEHGIGILKASYLKQYADPQKLAIMRQLKQSLDPKNILNPRLLF